MPSQSLMAVSSQQSQPSLNKDQSLELVKIFLNASLACICHTRELINWQSECFRTRYIDQVSLNVEDIYHSFCGPESASPGKSQEVRVLIRGGSRRADAILDMVVRMTNPILSSLTIAGARRVQCNRENLPRCPPDLHHHQLRILQSYPRDLHL